MGTVSRERESERARTCVREHETTGIVNHRIHSSHSASYSATHYDGGIILLGSVERQTNAKSPLLIGPIGSPWSGLERGSFAQGCCCHIPFVKPVHASKHLQILASDQSCVCVCVCMCMCVCVCVCVSAHVWEGCKCIV
jgi:hypothetical protein